MTNEQEPTQAEENEAKLREAMTEVRHVWESEGKVPVPEWFDDAIVEYVNAGILSSSLVENLDLDDDEDDDEDDDTEE